MDKWTPYLPFVVDRTEEFEEISPGVVYRHRATHNELVHTYPGNEYKSKENISAQNKHFKKNCMNSPTTLFNIL